jgi:hypothetical protein
MSTAFVEVEEAKLANVPANEAHSTDVPPEAVLTQLMLGSLASQVVYVAAKLGIADLLVDGPKPVAELALSTNTDEASLYRILRALSSLGVFAEKPNRVFESTAIAQPLLSGRKNSLRDVVIFMGEDWHWDVWGQTLYSVQTGKPAWGKVHGAEVFEYFAENKEPARIFDQAMSSFTGIAADAVVEAYDFSGIETLVDIAGGQGRLLTGILEANPTTKGVLFDLPHVIEGAREKVRATNAASRIQFTTGDFFVSVPTGGDAYIMKHIIHDWDDARAITILQNIRKSMNPGGRVLLVEALIVEGNANDFGKLLDIEMLVSPGGKERTETEYSELFAKAGLKLTRIVPTKSPYSVIEALAQ